MLRRFLTSLVSLLCLLFIVPAALAGGWAVVTLDELPAEVRSGQSLLLGFMVRQHGRTPTNDVKPYLEARNLDTGEALQIEARQEGPVGHFVVDVTFPSAGSWEWAIIPAPFAGTAMPALQVLPGSAPQGGAQVAVPQLDPGRAALRWGGFALLLSAAAIGAYSLRGTRRASQRG